MNAKQLFNLGKRSFSTLHSYSSASNPRVFITVA